MFFAAIIVPQSGLTKFSLLVIFMVIGNIIMAFNARSVIMLDYNN